MNFNMGFAKFLFIVIIVFLSSLNSPKTLAQGDTTYYSTFPGQITSRLYTSRKYTALVVQDNQIKQSFRFEPNSSLNLGVGATYNDFTLNLAFGFGFMNPKRITEKTQYLDLQAHIYPRDYVIDLFGQFYSGYFLEDSRSLNEQGSNNIVLGEMKVRKFGLNVQRLFNGEQISMKAAFLQSAWQKKSAGSFLAGVEVYGGYVTNDGLLLPTLAQPDITRNFSGLGFIQAGPNVGYVHTFVFWKYFFITGMASGNVSLGRSHLDFPTGKEPQWGVSFNQFVRGFVGYNGPKWGINANYVHNNVRLTPNSDISNSMMTGNYRINFIYRFTAGPKLKPYLEYVDISRYLNVNPE